MTNISIYKKIHLHNTLNKYKKAQVNRKKKLAKHILNINREQNKLKCSS